MRYIIYYKKITTSHASSDYGRTYSKKMFLKSVSSTESTAKP